MSRRRRRSRRRSGASRMVLIVIIAAVLLAAAAGAFLFVTHRSARQKQKQPDELLTEYMQFLAAGNYDAMYELLNAQSRLNISREDFVARNRNIYEGIEAADIRVEIKGTEQKENGSEAVNYQTTMNSQAGEISFFNQVDFRLEEIPGEDGKKSAEEYRMIWNDWVIFPQLGRTDKVRVSTDRADRGSILDRNGNLLAGEGTASLVGLVPGKMNRDPAGPGGYAAGDLERLSGLLGISVEGITKKLSAGWVRDDSLVPVKTLKHVDELNLLADKPDEANLQNQALQEELLTVPGVMITDTTVRSYPLGEKAAHLVGYVQNVTAEDLERHPGEGYLADSVIGRSGMEGLFEKELKGQNGTRIAIVTQDGEEKLVLASIPRTDGQDIRLTIDGGLQQTIYDAFRDRKSCTVAMNPRTGEVLALVNTPSFDNNDFILGMSQEKWTALNEDERNPMLNRFRQRFAPGSSFKPITGIIGLSTGAFGPQENFGEDAAGLSWQKDGSWGRYYVTTLHGYSPVNLENALIYSDNIYFARAALKIGSENFTKGLDALGFNQEIPFEIAVAQAQYSNTETIGTEIQLADSGYGQGQVLINPVHLASLYTMFPNRGTVLKPYLLYKENPAPEAWIENACTPENAEIIENALVKVVNSEHGTGHKAMRDDVVLAGKTGTAEIKASKDDATGTELGWFAVYTKDLNLDNPLLMVSMVEDVKNDGGSGVAVEKSKEVFERYILQKSAE